MVMDATSRPSGCAQRSRGGRARGRTKTENGVIRPRSAPATAGRRHTSAFNTPRPALAARRSRASALTPLLSHLRSTFLLDLVKYPLIVTPEANVRRV